MGMGNVRNVDNSNPDINSKLKLDDGHSQVETPQRAPLIQNEPEPHFFNNEQDESITTNSENEVSIETSLLPSDVTQNCLNLTNSTDSLISSQHVNSTMSTVFVNEDLLFEILKRVNRTELFKCRLVSSHWEEVAKRIIRLWSLSKIHHINEFTLKDFSTSTYYSMKNLGKNLLRDPQLSLAVERFEFSVRLPRNVSLRQKWQSSGIFNFENPSREGADASSIPANILIRNGFGSASQFIAISTSSENTLIQYQDIVLDKAGIFHELMDKVKPTIVAEEWVGTRYDCGSVCRLTLELFNESSVEPICIKSVKVQQGNNDTNGSWRKVTISCKNYPCGIRRIRYIRSGRDDKHWSGFYGAKLAMPKLSLMLSRLSRNSKAKNELNTALMHDKRAHNQDQSNEPGEKKTKVK
ncbi:F-box only protein 44-like [Cloeon dipterum]|uniref:F-box only protein 44-like n=1 Tax=Cloeon dipterum TaxID=197152 RepID=UPI00321F9F3E